MERGGSSVLAAPDVPMGDTDAEGTAHPGRGRRRLRRALVGMGNSCALVGVALLACAGLIAVGTVASILWTLVVER
jgi:hypothetical protein